MRRHDYLTVSKLIRRLKEFEKIKPDATVGIKAACCSHAHHVQEIRWSGDDDWQGEAEIVIDANE